MQIFTWPKCPAFRLNSPCRRFLHLRATPSSLADIPVLVQPPLQYLDRVLRQIAPAFPRRLHRQIGQVGDLHELMVVLLFGSGLIFVSAAARLEPFSICNKFSHLCRPREKRSRIDIRKSNQTQIRLGVQIKNVNKLTSEQVDSWISKSTFGICRAPNTFPIRNRFSPFTHIYQRTKSPSWSLLMPDPRNGTRVFQ